MAVLRMACKTEYQRPKPAKFKETENTRTGSYQSYRAALAEHFLSGNDCVAVDRYRVFKSAGVATRVCGHDRNLARSCQAEDKLIALFQALHTKSQTAQLIISVRISARNVADQVGLHFPQPRTQSIVEPSQVILIAGPVRQIDVNRRRRFYG